MVGVWGFRGWGSVECGGMVVKNSQAETLEGGFIMFGKHAEVIGIGFKELLRGIRIL